MTLNNKVQHVKRFDNYTIRVNSPVGSVYLHILEHNNQPVMIQCSAGKCGTELSSFVTGACNLITTMLENGIPLIKAIGSLSEINTDKITLDNGVNVRSGIDGVKTALLRYIEAKHLEVKVKNYAPRMDKRNIA